MAVSKAQRQAHGKRAAIYARVSDKSQAEDDKTSLSEQIGDMEAHCEGKGMTVTARYQEVGRGWSKKRPEFQRMLADAKRGRFDTIVCWKSDRLSRGMYPAAALMEVIEAYHINLEAVMDAIDMKTFGLMAAIGKIELDNFRERASMGKRGTAKQGRIPVSNLPYGYRIGDDGRPVIVEEEAEVVRRVYRMCVNDGLGAYLIARQLNLEGVPLAKLGKRWYDGTIHRILSNETYKGTWWYGKARYVSTEDGVRVYEQPQDDWIGVPFPPLVDEETWGRARVLRRQRFTRAKRNTKVFYLLQHLVRCTECGLLMGGSANTKKEVKRNGKLYKYELDPPRRYYRCYGYQQLRLKCRQKPMVRAERLEGLVWARSRGCWRTPTLSSLVSRPWTVGKTAGWPRRLTQQSAIFRRSSSKRRGSSGCSCQGRSPRTSSTISAGTSPSGWRRSGLGWMTTAIGRRLRTRSGWRWSTSSSGSAGLGMAWTICPTRDAGRCCGSCSTG